MTKSTGIVYKRGASFVHTIITHPFLTPSAPAQKQHKIKPAPKRNFKFCALILNSKRRRILKKIMPCIMAACAFINHTSAHQTTLNTTKKLVFPITLLGFTFSEVLALGFLALYVCCRVWIHRRMQRDSKNPKTWPIIGSQLEAVQNYDRLLDWITGYFCDDHRTIKMSILSRCSYLTVDPANVEHILKTNFHNYPKGQESHHRLFDLLGNGILNTDGNMWKLHRKLGSLEFSIKKLKKLSSTVYKTNALRLVEVLANSTQGVDIQELLLNMTFNSICEVVFGSKIMEESICVDPSIANTLDNAQEMITRRYMFPWWRLQRFFNIGSERVVHRDITRFNKFLSHVIKERMARMKEEAETLAAAATTLEVGGAAEDLLSRFILHFQNQASTECKKHNIEEKDDAEKIREEVRDAITSFVMAGRDTTASTLTWFLYCMCLNPHVQEEVHEELMKLENNDYSSNNISMCEWKDDGDIKKGGQSGCSVKVHLHHMKEFAEKVVCYEALQSSSSPYLHAALAETLRLYPAVPRQSVLWVPLMLPLLLLLPLLVPLPLLLLLALLEVPWEDGKVALRDDVLPDGTHLKAGDQVVYIPYAMGRMPFLWGNDAFTFKPERWLANQTFQPQSPFKFTAFQAGPRMCLGKDAAYLQMKITAAMLLRFFRFQLVPNHQVQYRMMMVMTMKHGLRVNVTLR